MSTAGVQEVSLLRRGRLLEIATLAWNVVGVAVLAPAAISARSVALEGFGINSLIEIGASTVVLWKLASTSAARQHRALNLIASAFAVLAGALGEQSEQLLAHGHYHPKHGGLGMVWTAITAAVMFALAAGKTRTGEQSGNPVLIAEGRVTAINAMLAIAVLCGLGLNVTLGWWWADPLGGLVIVACAVGKVLRIRRELGDAWT